MDSLGRTSQHWGVRAPSGPLSQEFEKLQRPSPFTPGSLFLCVSPEGSSLLVRHRRSGILPESAAGGEDGAVGQVLPRRSLRPERDQRRGVSARASIDRQPQKMAH